MPVLRGAYVTGRGLAESLVSSPSRTPTLSPPSALGINSRLLRAKDTVDRLKA